MKGKRQEICESYAQGSSRGREKEISEVEGDSRQSDSRRKEERRGEERRKRERGEEMLQYVLVDGPSVLVRIVFLSFPFCVPAV